jgi:type I restriction enzyme S subunit
MTALFDELIISNDEFEFDESLDDRIDFVNGLAMQNFRPLESEVGIPVIKIRELTQGYCDENSEFCSPSIDDSHIIRSGDLVFSWSGSLQAAFWTAGTAGLNQHLFKVESSSYPKWFIYKWVLFHLLNFQRIAENKGTTFGHIKREDLHAARIKKLNPDRIAKLNSLFDPILKALLCNSKELHDLMELQKVLLSNLSR